MCQANPSGWVVQEKPETSGSVLEVSLSQYTYIYVSCLCVCLALFNCLGYVRYTMWSLCPDRTYARRICLFFL